MCANTCIPNERMVQAKMKLNKLGVFHVKVHCSGRQNINPIRYLRDFYYTSI